MELMLCQQKGAAGHDMDCLKCVVTRISGLFIINSTVQLTSFYKVYNFNGFRIRLLSLGSIMTILSPF